MHVQICTYILDICACSEKRTGNGNTSTNALLRKA